MRLPLDSEILQSFTTTSEPESDNMDETVSALLQSREDAFSKALENINKAQKSQKEVMKVY